ncbi:MAG: gliding motility-associated C-terminal domain-containing protein [Ferruginibacter sp.]
MIKKLLVFIVFCFVIWSNSLAQTCTTLGQNPSTAFPVCGTNVFSQGTVPFCGGRSIPAPPCPRAPFSDKNPFWYKFTCFATGTLGFAITPNTPEDYDWEIFDITGRNPDAVYSDASLIVAFNWSAEFGVTGTSASAGSLRECDGPGVPLMSAMPTLTVGHTYILLVSHFTDTPNGYSLTFGGGTANITDPKEPHMESARAACDGTRSTIKLNKRMKCNSLTGSGSEFTLTPPLANVISATGFGCSNGFDMDSLILTLDTPLPPGTYMINIKNGTDGTTIKDNCDREIPQGESIPMIVYPLVPTPMDSLSKLGCAPDELQLVFRKNMKCSSIAADGSDFRVTLISGSTPVSVIGASGNCDADGLTPVIKVKLSAPIQTKGVYEIRLQTGSDGNTIIDECGQETPAGATLNFATKDTVNADFSYTIGYGCERDTIDYFHDGRNEVNFWKWNFDRTRNSSLQNPTVLYGSFGEKKTFLIVSNGVCRDTSDTVRILLDNEVKAAFTATPIVCPNEFATFMDNSIGNIVSWNWDFANGTTSSSQSPSPQSYFATKPTREVFPRLIVQNNLGCFDTTVQKILIPYSCYIAVPNAFTPNRDGLNDYLYPLNAYKAIDLLFRVYNRVGQLVFETRDWTTKWDGRFKGQPADLGTYVWILTYTDGDTGEARMQKGTTILLK